MFEMLFQRTQSGPEILEEDTAYLAERTQLEATIAATQESLAVAERLVKCGPQVEAHRNQLKHATYRLKWLNNKQRFFAWAKHNNVPWYNLRTDEEWEYLRHRVANATLDKEGYKKRVYLRNASLSDWSYPVPLAALQVAERITQAFPEASLSVKGLQMEYERELDPDLLLYLDSQLITCVYRWGA